MIHGIGVDIVDISRMEQILKRWENRFTQRVFTQAEVLYCSQKAQPAGCYALRFAAKEAFSKALGLGLRNGIRFQHIEIRHDTFGKPYLTLHRRCKEICTERGIENTFLSLSDDGGYALAMVVLER
jgi:holo-[acyl-carrier protein] synthase